MQRSHIKYLIISILLILSCPAFSQAPVLMPLEHNPALKKRELTRPQRSSTTLVELPFFDDFSYYWHSTHPVDSLWIDKNVFINNNFIVNNIDSLLPRSIGVATFDALDANGHIYKSLSVNSSAADTLTSRPINLDENDSNVWLSFYYQAGGLGDMPGKDDVLIVQFKSLLIDSVVIKNGDDTLGWRKFNRWLEVERISNDNATVQAFKQKNIKIVDSLLYEGFQFRFINYVSLDNDRNNLGRRSNSDLWHIDYVYLDKDRTDPNIQDMIDIAMVRPLHSLLRGYQSVPWKHLSFGLEARQGLELQPAINMSFRNNYHDTRYLYDYYFTITEYKDFKSTAQGIFDITDPNNKTVVTLSGGGALNVEANSIQNFSRDIINPFQNSTATDSTLFVIEGILGTIGDEVPVNDTVRYYQFFKDFFARDDGIPESGYGFRGYNAQNHAVACRYQTFMPDFLKSVMIYFNPTENNVTANYRFRVAIWSDNNGVPGDILYLSDEKSPTNFGEFSTFEITRDVYVTGFFWIGWVQVTSGFLNVGFDFNYNDVRASGVSNLWYNDGAWKADRHEGTLMLRPVMQQNTNIVTSEIDPKPVVNQIKIYPNPAHSQIRIDIETSETMHLSDYELELYDIVGRLRYRSANVPDYLNVEGLEVGTYFVIIANKRTGKLHTERLLIVR